MGIGDWEFGIGDWRMEIVNNIQSQIPNSNIKLFIIIIKLIYLLINFAKKYL